MLAVAVHHSVIAGRIAAVAAAADERARDNSNRKIDWASEIAAADRDGDADEGDRPDETSKADSSATWMAQGAKGS